VFEGIVRRIRFGSLAPLFERRVVSEWEKQGRPIPPPGTVKRKMILEFARRFNCRTLVETGTYKGDTLWALRKDFDRLYSIELDQTLHAAAAKRFAGMSHITLIPGDSGEKLRQVLDLLEEKAIFWLDGHFCGPGTAMGTEEAPVMREIQAVFDHQTHDHVVLLDDARLFVGRAGYPKVDDLDAWVQARRSGWVCEVVADVVRVYPGL